MLSKIKGKNVLIFSIFIMLLALLRPCIDQFPKLIHADFSNPDSFYKLVLVKEYAEATGFQYMARDNAPDGFYQHWSAVHSWSILQFHHVLRKLRLTHEMALIWAGAAVTVLSMLTLAFFVSWVILNQGSSLAAIAAAIALAANIPLRTYGQPLQITHHIFMLVPLAGAAAILIDFHPLRRGRHFWSFLGGVLLAMALWISPETSPFIAILIAVCIAIRIQCKINKGVWPVAVGFISGIALAWVIDPPPPTFSEWALDHVSLAWLLFAILSAILMLFADILAVFRLPLASNIGLLFFAATSSALVWLLMVPNALHGSEALIPSELKTLWWDKVIELKPLSTTSEYIAYISMPVLSGFMMFFFAYQQRALWMLMLATGLMMYAALSAMHVRSGAAAGLLAAISYGLVLSRIKSFRDEVLINGSLKEQGLVSLFILVPVAQLVSSPFLEKSELISSYQSQIKDQCRVEEIASKLNSLPAGVVLINLNDAPELLWRTKHSVIAGNYHHNAHGLLDSFHIWESRVPDLVAQDLIQERKVKYIVGCGRQIEGRADHSRFSLEERVKAGMSINWLFSKEKIGDWYLYRTENADRI